MVIPFGKVRKAFGFPPRAAERFLRNQSAHTLPSVTKGRFASLKSVANSPTIGS